MGRNSRIEEAIRSALTPAHLEVADESHRHSVPEGAESHFKVLAVSESFADKSLVARHRTVNQLLAAEF